MPPSASQPSRAPPRSRHRIRTALAPWRWCPSRRRRGARMLLSAEVRVQTRTPGPAKKTRALPLPGRHRPTPHTPLSVQGARWKQTPSRPRSPRRGCPHAPGPPRSPLRRWTSPHVRRDSSPLLDPSLRLTGYRHRLAHLLALRGMRAPSPMQRRRRPRRGEVAPPTTRPSCPAAPGPGAALEPNTMGRREGRMRLSP